MADKSMYEEMGKDMEGSDSEEAGESDADEAKVRDSRGRAGVTGGDAVCCLDPNFTRGHGATRAMGAGSTSPASG